MRLTTPSFVLLSLLDAASSLLARRRHAQIKPHRPQTPHGRRDSITIVAGVPVVTQVSEVVVFVDANGQPIRTATEVVVLVPSTIAPALPSSSVTTASPTCTPVQSTSRAGLIPTQVPDAGATGGDSGQFPSGPGGIEDGGSTGASTGLHGVSYSPRNADGSCKSGSRVFSDLQRIAARYGLVRIYGVDCDQVGTVISAAKSAGLKVFLGIFDLDGLESQIAELVGAVETRGDWSLVEAVSVGNELVNNGQATAQQVIKALVVTRQLLRRAGFRGPMVTVDTFVAVLRSPWLCDYSDFCALNIHPFFDRNTHATAAGNFVYTQVAAVRRVLKNPKQRIVVTETGWPWQGCANGDAVPGKDNQRTAIASTKTVFGAGNPGNLILFSAFNDLWKKPEARTFYAEQYWGIDQF